MPIASSTVAASSQGLSYLRPVQIFPNSNLEKMIPAIAGLRKANVCSFLYVVHV
jgi:hypothetical protein